MAYCTNCGKPMEDGDRFCKSCGASTSGYGEVNQNFDTYADQRPKKRKIKAGMLTFSILMTLFASRVLGIIAIVFTALAARESTDEGEKEKLKVAKILNIVALVVLILAILLVIGLVVLALAFGSDILSDVLNEYTLSLII